jgi:hypothetical protein
MARLLKAMEEEDLFSNAKSVERVIQQHNELADGLVKRLLEII